MSSGLFDYKYCSLYSGNQTYAITSLTILGLGYAERRHYFPIKVKQIYQYMIPQLCMMGLLCTGDWLSRIAVLMEIYSKVYQFFFCPSTVSYDAISHPSLLKYTQFTSISNKQVSFQVCRDHVQINPFPYGSSHNFEPLMQWSETLNWMDPDILVQVDKALIKDARWLGSEEKTQYENDQNDQIKINYVKSRLATLIAAIKDESIETGEPLNYHIIKNYLGYIAQKLPEAEKDQQIQLLLQLAIDGGDYCGPGVYQQLETIAYALLQNQKIENTQKNSRLPLKQRLLLILQQERFNIVAGLHLISTNINPAINLLAGGEGDVHSLNQMIHLVASDFNLPDQGASQDPAALLDPISTYHFRYQLGMYPEDLWKTSHFKVFFKRDQEGSIKALKTLQKQTFEGYTPKRIYDAIQSQIGGPLISNQDVIDWALEWIQTSNASEEEKQTFIDQLGEGNVFMDEKLHFKDFFIQAMLVDMGILKTLN